MSAEGHAVSRPHILSPAGMAALGRVLSGRALVAFDFDGTLAPICDHPADARVPAAVAETAARLCELVPVAVLSGRALGDLQSRLPFAPAFVVGNHGAEDPLDPQPVDTEVLQAVRDRLALHARDLAAAGVSVEDKGLTFALHYRLAADPDLAQRCLSIALASLSPKLSLVGGKCVLNVAPAGTPDKAAALQRLVARAGAEAVVFVGDDLNDEPAFERAPPHWVTVRVGREHADTHARYVLDDQAQVPDLLQALVQLAEPAAQLRAAV